MASIVIKNAQGKALGKLVDSPSGRTFAQTMVGNSKGYYDPSANKTFTMEGRIISSGNTLAALLV